jgi:hypothetical protein
VSEDCTLYNARRLRTIFVLRTICWPCHGLRKVDPQDGHNDLVLVSEKYEKKEKVSHNVDWPLKKPAPRFLHVSNDAIRLMVGLEQDDAQPLAKTLQYTLSACGNLRCAVRTSFKALWG